MQVKGIEDILTEQAKSLGMSTAKLKAIYLRGVEECLSGGYDGLPSVYGMARVQRFVIATKTGNYRLTPDSEFSPNKPLETETISYEITDDTFNGWSLVYDVMSLKGNKVAEMFPPGSVEQTVYDSDKNELSVLGTHDKVQWVCTLNLSTGENTFVTSDD